jgi:acyl-CoA synthetase (NDP forming)
MAPLGVPVVVGAIEDPRFGPLVSFAVGGIASELLGDTVWRMVPLLDADAEEMVRAPRAAPLLSGYRGAEPVLLGAVQDLLLRVARLKEDLPEVATVELNPVLVTPTGLRVLGAAVTVGEPVTRLDYGPRRML